MKVLIVLTLLASLCLTAPRELFEVHEVPGEVEINHRKTPAEQKTTAKTETQQHTEKEEEELHPSHRQYVDEQEYEENEEQANDPIEVAPVPDNNQEKAAEVEIQPAPKPAPSKTERPKKPKHEHSRKDSKPYKIVIESEETEEMNNSDEAVNDDAKHTPVFGSDVEFEQGLFGGIVFLIMACLLIKRCIRVKVRRQYVQYPNHAAYPQNFEVNMHQVPLNPSPYRQYAPQVQNFAYGQYQQY